MHLREELISILDKANEIRTHKLNHSVELAEKVLMLSDQHNFIDLKARALSQLSLYRMIIGQNDESLENAKNSITLFEELRDEKGIADAKYSIAGVYYKTDNYHIGLVFLIDALNIYKKFDDYYNISRCEKSLGTVYEYSGDQNSAIQSYENAISAAQKINNLNLESNAYNNLSGIYIKQEKLDLAWTIIKKSIALKTQTGDIRGLAFAIYGRAKVLFALKKYEEAEADFLEAIKIHDEMGERLGLAMSYHKLAKLYWEKKQLDSAKEALDKGLELSNTYNITVIRLKCYHLFYAIYKQVGNKTAALEYLEFYLEEKEKVLNTQTLKVIDNYDMLVRMKTMQKEADLQKEKAVMIEKTNRAEQAARVRQEFLSTMSHEIRTPLNAITTVTALLSDSPNKEEQKLIDSLKFSSNHLMRIINDILDFSKLDLGKMKLELNPIRIVPLFENISKTYELQAREKGLEFLFKNNISQLETYFLDDTKLSQILGNLISNAIKFTDKGHVELGIELINRQKKHDIIRFTISDTGEGIEKENLKKIFESFSQIKNTITRKKDGTGLGLAIVKSLVKLHGSAIKVESVLGKGSRFYFELKLKKVTTIIKKSQNSPMVSLEGKKVLLAEDNQINAMIAMKLLSKWGIESTHAINGVEAVAMAQIHTFDCILMDIHMPEMDGFDATKQIRNSGGFNKDVPVFGLTADISAADNNEFNTFFSGFLLKPIEIEKLKLALSSIK